MYFLRSAEIMKVPSCSSFGFWSLFIFCNLSVIVNANIHEDDGAWLNPYDMLYDPTSKCMRKPTEFDEQKKKGTASSINPVGLRVFKRFLTKLLKETSKLGLPDDGQTSVHYDAEVKLSKQSLAEIQKLLNEENDWTTGAMDEALSQILVRFKLHDHEAWKWRFEDTFYVDADTALKVAFAEHKKNIVEVESFNGKCTGLKQLDWKDSLSEWYRRTWTLQDDPCKKYYEVLVVNPILLVPPTSAIIVTITSFITDPLKQIGQGISEFLRALLQDLPVTLQLPVLLIITVAILMFMYGSAQAAMHQAVRLPRLGWRRDQPPPAAGQHQAPQLQEHEEARDRGDAPQPLQDNRNRVNQAGNQGDRGFTAADAHSPQSMEHQQEFSEFSGQSGQRWIKGNEGVSADLP